MGTLLWWMPFVEPHLSLGPIWLLLDLPFAAICHRLPDRTMELG